MELQEVLTRLSKDDKDIDNPLVIDSGVAAGKPTDFMLIATCIAEKSKQEKPSKFFDETIPQPNIGAVIVVGNKAYCSARSGYKTGDHAEYTVINSMAKKDNSDLSLATLYTTLEPCTPASRKDWTECCSKLIIDSRIRKVYVGSIDGNPLVTGVGLKYLLDDGIDVQFFTKELSDKCREINREFFLFLDKVADPKTIKVIKDAIWDYLDECAVRFYCVKRGFISDVKSYSNETSLSFIKEMVMRGAIKEGDKLSKIDVSISFAIAFFIDPSIKVTGYGVDFYNEITKKGSSAVEPERKVIKSSALIACRETPMNDINSDKNIFCRIIREYYGISKDKEETASSLKTLFKSFAQGRELIINSVVHNDYSANPRISFRLEKGSIKITDAANVGDTEIGLLNAGSMPSIPQNPELMDFFEACGLTEHHGYGMKEIRKMSDSTRKSSGMKDLMGNDDKRPLVFSRSDNMGVSCLSTNIPVHGE